MKKRPIASEERVPMTITMEELQSTIDDSMRSEASKEFVYYKNFSRISDQRQKRFFYSCAIKAGKETENQQNGRMP